MNPGWRVIDCTQLVGSLRYERGQLVVISSQTDTTTKLPIAQLAVVLVGVQVSVSGAVLAKLGEYDVVLLVCDWRNVPVAGAYPWSAHTRIGARTNAQASMSKPARKRAWAAVIKAKIFGQIATARALTGQDDPKLSGYPTLVLSGDSSNIEAQAARHYWAVISEHDFSRHPSTGMDFSNSALDYGYTVLRGIGIRAVCSAGLNGALGIFHHGRSNNFALVDDLMEPFRPFVDYAVFGELDTAKDFGSLHKQHLVEYIKAAPFTANGETVSTVFESFAQSFGLYAEGNITDLVVPQWKGPADAGNGK